MGCIWEKSSDGVETQHTYLLGCSQPAPAEVSGSGWSMQDHLMTSRQVGVGAPQ